MKIIRGKDFAEGFCLCIQWHMNRCNQRACTNQPSVIVVGAEYAGEKMPTFALCEDCFQLGNKPGRYQYDIVFGDVEDEAQAKATAGQAMAADGIQPEVIP